MRAWRVAFAAMIGIVACGTLTGPPDDSNGVGDGGGSEASQDDDGGTVVPRCDPSKPFELRQPVSAIPDGIDTLWLSSDGLRAVMSGRLNGGATKDDVFSAVRASPTARFDLSYLDASSDADDTRPVLTPDEQTMLFASERTSTARLWITHREDGGFVEPTEFDAGVGKTEGPWISPTSGDLYFSRDLSGDKKRIHVGTKLGATWTNFRLVGTFADADEENPVLTNDELVMFFSSDVEDAGVGGSDVYMATRSAKNLAFGPPVNLGSNVNTKNDEYPLWVSPDGCDLYVGTDANARKVFVASRGK